MTHQTERLDPATHMDTLSLRVADLPAMVRYYTDGRSGAIARRRNHYPRPGR